MGRRCLLRENIPGSQRQARGIAEAARRSSRTCTPGSQAERGATDQGRRVHGRVPGVHLGACTASHGPGCGSLWRAGPLSSTPGSRARWAGKVTVPFPFRHPLPPTPRQSFWAVSREKKGYSGVVTYASPRWAPVDAWMDCLGSGDSDIDREGRRAGAGRGGRACHRIRAAATAAVPLRCCRALLQLLGRGPCGWAVLRDSGEGMMSVPGSAFCNRPPRHSHARPLPTHSHTQNARMPGTGRVVITDHVAFVLLNVYVPNAGERPARSRLGFKLDFLRALKRKADEFRSRGRQVRAAWSCTLGEREPSAGGGSWPAAP